jgi:hypothetical protein
MPSIMASKGRSSFGVGPPGAAVREVLDQALEAGTSGEVVLVAAQGVLDHRLGLLDVPDAPLQVGVMALEELPPVLGGAGGQQVAELLQAQPTGLAADDHGDAGDVVLGVAAPPVQPRGGEQAHRLPMTEHVRRQVEPGRQLADRHGCGGGATA